MDDTVRQSDELKLDELRYITSVIVTDDVTSKEEWQKLECHNDSQVDSLLNPILNRNVIAVGEIKLFWCVFCSN